MAVRITARAAAVLLVLGALVVATLAWGLASSGWGGGVAAPTGSTDLIGSSRAGLPASQDAALGGAGASGGAARDGRDPAASVQRDAAADTPPVVPPESFTLRILRDGPEGDQGEGEEAVPGAEVWFYSEAMIGSLDRVLRDLGDAASDTQALIRAVGERRVANGKGEVSLPTDSHRIDVFARDGGWTGSENFELRRGVPQGEPVLRLRRGLTVRVLVQDRSQSHAPLANVAVMCGARMADGGFLEFGRATSDSTGLTVIPNLTPWADLLAGPNGSSLEGGNMVVRADVAGLDLSFISPVPNVAGEVLVELPLEGVGFVEARIVTPSGSAVPVEGHIGVTPPGETLSWADPDHADHQLRTESEHLFAVCSGRSYSLQLRVGRVTAEQVFVAPAPGETRVVSLELGAAEPVLVGRLVDEEGRALVGDSLYLRIWADGGRELRTRVAMGGDGRFASVLAPWLDGATVSRCEWWLHAADQPPRVGSSDLGLMRAGERALGDVVLTVPPRLVSVWFTVDGRPAYGNFQPAMVVEQQIVTDAGEAAWESLSRAYHVKRRTGERAVYGEVPTAPLRVVVGGGREAVLPVAPIPFEVGAELLVECSTGGDAAMEVVGDPAMWGDLRAELVWTGSDSSGAARAGGVQDGAARFWGRVARVEDGDDAPRLFWRTLRPGSYDLAVRMMADSTPVHTRSGLQVVAGEHADWPPLMLDDLVAMATVAVSVGGGGPLPPACWLIPQRASSEPGCVAVREGVATLGLPAGVRTPALVVAAGYVPVALDVRPGDQAAVLEPLPVEVTVQLDPAVLEAVPGVAWSVTMTADAGGGSGAGSNRAAGALSPEQLGWLRDAGRFSDILEQLDGAYRGTLGEGGLVGQAKLRVPAAAGWRLRLNGSALVQVRRRAFAYEWPDSVSVPADGVLPLVLPAAARERAQRELR